MSRDLLPAPDRDYACCWQAANTGGDSCTCWTRVLDVLPTPAVAEGPPEVRRRMCGDCAYRPGSPERQAEDGGLPAIPHRHRFFCHQGVPRTIRWEHPSGAVVHVADLEALEGDYQPITRQDRIWRADGQPGELCAGWAATTRARHPEERP